MATNMLWDIASCLLEKTMLSSKQRQFRQLKVFISIKQHHFYKARSVLCGSYKTEQPLPSNEHSRMAYMVVLFCFLIHYDCDNEFYHTSHCRGNLTMLLGQAVGYLFYPLCDALSHQLMEKQCPDHLILFFIGDPMLLVSLTNIIGVPLYQLIRKCCLKHHPHMLKKMGIGLVCCLLKEVVSNCHSINNDKWRKLSSFWWQYNWFLLFLNKWAQYQWYLSHYLEFNG